MKKTISLAISFKKLLDKRTSVHHNTSKRPLGADIPKN